LPGAVVDVVVVVVELFTVDVVVVVELFAFDVVMLFCC
jgi:hypothetical protein